MTVWGTAGGNLVPATPTFVPGLVARKTVEGWCHHMSTVKLMCVCVERMCTVQGSCGGFLDLWGGPGSVREGALCLGGFGWKGAVEAQWW